MNNLKIEKLQITIIYQLFLFKCSLNRLKMMLLNFYV